jgi:hypothetical protein
MKYCGKCQSSKPIGEFSKSKNKKDGLQTYCKLCFKILREQNKAHYQSWYTNNRDKRLKYLANWKKENPDKHCSSQARRRAKKLERMLKWGKQELKLEIDNWYRRAKLATIFMGESYQVDHVIPLQGKTVSGLHVPWNLTILTASENRKKGINYEKDF